MVQQGPNGSHVSTGRGDIERCAESATRAGERRDEEVWCVGEKDVDELAVAVGGCQVKWGVTVWARVGLGEGEAGDGCVAKKWERIVDIPKTQAVWIGEKDALRMSSNRYLRGW